MNNRQAVCHEGLKFGSNEWQKWNRSKKCSLRWADQALSGSYYPTSQIPLLPTAPSEGLWSPLGAPGETFRWQMNNECYHPYQPCANRKLLRRRTGMHRRNGGPERDWPLQMSQVCNISYCNLRQFSKKQLANLSSHSGLDFLPFHPSNPLPA